MNNSQLQYKAKVFDQNPKAALFFEVAEALQTLQEVKKLFSQVQLLENIKGPKGDDGHTPTRDELLRLIVPLIQIPDDGHTPTTEELTTLIKPLIPAPQDVSQFLTEEDTIAIIEAYMPFVIPDLPVTPTVVEITPLEIANKLNSLEGMIKLSALEKFPTLDDFLKELNDPKSKKKIRSQVIDMNDLRWHGGGLSTVAHDATLTGTGTTASPLSVVSAGGTWYQDEIVATGTTGTVFSLLHTPASIVFLYKNGQYLVSGIGYDYTRVTTTITLTDTLISSDILTANYQ